MTALPQPVDRRPHRLPWPLLLSALEDLYGPCILCEHRCGALRARGERGACGLAEHTHVYNRMLHLGEERELVPSYTLFLSGCSMLCSFCSESAHLRPPFQAPPADPQALAGRVAEHLRALRQRVPLIRNVNLVGGEPSIQLPFLARFAAALEAHLGPEDTPPFLLNTNGYMTPEALALASHLCAIFVVDLKFGDPACADTHGDAPRYVETLQRNLLLLTRARAAGPAGLERAEGAALLPVELWVRHLLMPGHLACCTEPALRWLAEHAPDVRLNVMPAFVPFKGETNTRWAPLGDDERAAALDLLRSLPLRGACFDGRRLEAK